MPQIAFGFENMYVVCKVENEDRNGGCDKYFDALAYRLHIALPESWLGRLARTQDAFLVPTHMY